MPDRSRFRMNPRRIPSAGETACPDLAGYALRDVQPILSLRGDVAFG
jgi:hypothetical protein